MATIIPTFAKIRGPAGGIDAVVVTWSGLANSGDVGQAIQRPDILDRSFQAAGSFGGGTVVCEGSNDGTNFGTLTNVAGGSVTFTATAAPMQVVEATAYIRPHMTAGSSASVTVTMLLRRTYR